MSFDRFRSQTFCESLMGCSNFKDFRALDCNTFESFTLNRSNALALGNFLVEDAKDLFYKGHLSLAESLYGFRNRNYSWAIIKGYYSVFYMLRADLALRNIALIRHRSIYYIEAKDGAKPKTKGRKGSSRSEYSTDHKATINYYKDLFRDSDILLSQSIDGVESYDWLMKKREQINYQERYFNEPYCSTFLSFIDSQIINGFFNSLISNIVNDNSYILAFQPEYAPLAIPIHRRLLTRKNFIDNSIEIELNESQRDHLNFFGELTLE